MMATSGLTKPMINTTENTMELVNEAFVLIMTYHLYMFTDFMTDLKMRGFVGFSMIAITVLNVLLSIGVVVVATLSIAARKLKLKYLQWK
jgi:hypothetical protein